jgi:ferredoxin
MSAVANRPATSPLTIDLERCDGCGWCVTVCPVDVLSLEETTNKPIVVYPLDCQFCDTCVVECHLQAIELEPMVSFRAPPSIYEVDLRTLGPGRPRTRV